MKFFLIYVNASVKMRKLSTILLISILLAAGFAACTGGSVYHEYKVLPEEGWHRDSILHYEVEIGDSLSLNNFYINIRNNTDYPYSNIYFFITTIFPNGHSTRDTIECILAARDGRWLGSGSGSIRDNKIMLQQAMKFPLTGTYHIYLEQGMRKEMLRGIEDVGFSIEAYEP
jgi:gliding motility-associated lipoprotein GldH